MEDFISPSVDRKAYYSKMAFNKRHGIPCMRTCKVCGKQFEINNRFRKYCSEKCVEAAKRLRLDSLRVKDGVKYSKTCKVCGKEFVANSTAKVCCSTKCAKTRENDLKREHRRQAAGVYGEISCAFCHKAFTPVKLGQKFCSNKCNCAFKYWNGDVSVRNAHMTSAEGYGEKTCAWCGKTFTSHRCNQKCCSDECSGKHRNHKCSEAEYLEAKARRQEERQMALRSKREREAVSAEGLTAAQVAEVVMAQDGDPSLLWQRSQKWTAKQHAFAKRRYCYIHGL